MFSSPLLSTRDQNEIFVFVPVFSSLRERKAPVSARRHRRARAKPNPPPHVRFARQNSTPRHLGALAGGFERGESQAWAPALKDTNAAPREATPQRAYRGNGYAKSIAPSHSRHQLRQVQSRQVQTREVARAERLRALSRRDGRHSRGARPALYIQRVVIRSRDGSMRRRNGPTETVNSPSRVWRVGGSAIQIPSPEGFHPGRGRRILFLRVPRAGVRW